MRYERVKSNLDLVMTEPKTVPLFEKSRSTSSARWNQSRDEFLPAQVG